MPIFDTIFASFHNKTNKNKFAYYLSYNEAIHAGVSQVENLNCESFVKLFTNLYNIKSRL